MAAYAQLFESLEALIASSAVNDEVSDLLLPSGSPLAMEAQLWDYKRELPIAPAGSDDSAAASYKAHLADLMKDAVALHNSYGGYLVFGVADKGASRLIGCDIVLDTGDFNKRLEGATGQSIECLFGQVQVKGRAGAVKVGLLLVPRRPDNKPPATFRKAAPAHISGKRAYAAHDCPVRIRDESRPATATSADWEFLHGPRKFSSGPGIRRAKQPIQVSMPPRDPDLVHFIGRDAFLSQLRAWLGDSRSAVRLLTGIGGLGKTSIAYKFAEEVVDLRAGRVEKLVWLTAKRRTFSALRGMIVETSRTDFDDATSLYKVLLDSLGYEPLFEDDEPTDADLLEAIHEALSCYNCLIIIDDVDSLPPDDQRNVVFSLSGVAARTVDGSATPSRILFTSRIDLGVPPSMVIKINGFDQAEFGQYVLSLGEALGVPIRVSDIEHEFYSATSGSPLFAASILRLVKLGSALPDSLARWRGEDGEDVRRFAFERELQQLSHSAGRLLYAICLLGRTTTVELAAVLELSASSVTSSIASLQSFHLVATSLGSKSGTSINAPDDVTLTMDVLRKHLGNAAEVIEAACSRARTAVESRRDQIAQAIGQIVSLWKSNDYKDALIVAERLAQSNPQNGDVACLYGTALLKPGIEKWAKADEMFAKADKFSCTRPELIEGWIVAKQQQEDWAGLLALTAQTVSTRHGYDAVLAANIKATQELIKLSRIRGDRSRRIELCKRVIETITTRLNAGRMGHADREDFYKHKFNFTRTLLDDVTSASPKAGDKIAIFEVTTWLVDQEVFVSEFVARGVHALSLWWADVEARPYIDERAIQLLKRSLSRLAKVERTLERRGKDDVASEVKAISIDLSYRAAKLLGG